MRQCVALAMLLVCSFDMAARGQAVPVPDGGEFGGYFAAADYGGYLDASLSVSPGDVRPQVAVCLDGECGIAAAGETVGKAAPPALLNGPGGAADVSRAADQRTQASQSEPQRRRGLRGLFRGRRVLAGATSGG